MTGSSPAARCWLWARATKPLVMAAVMTESSDRPPIMSNAAITFPGVWVGTTSPYPTVVIVSDRPPHPQPDGVERLVVDDPLHHAEPHHRERPEGSDHVGGVPRAQSPALQALVHPLLGPAQLRLLVGHHAPDGRIS